MRKNRKQLVMEAALFLFVDKGISDVSLQMILDQSGVSKGTFYKFFNSINDCILAIIELQQQEDFLLRKQLETQDYESDFDLLVDQIAVPMSLPEKQRVLELFWRGFYTGEIMLSDLNKLELNWLSERMVQIYGEKTKPYAYEGAALFFAMLHQISNTWKSYHHKHPEWKEVVPKVLRYVEVLMITMWERQESIIDFYTLSLIQPEKVNYSIEKVSLIDELNKFGGNLNKYDVSKKEKEIVTGLLLLLQQETLNTTLIEITLRSFQEEFSKGAFNLAAKKIIRDLWMYLEKRKLR